jgi:hypothetical protein
VQLPVLDPLPREVKLVRELPWGDKTMLLECSHPSAQRGTMLNGRGICLLCKGDDFSRTCLFVAVVPPHARPAPEDPQTTLF